MLVDPNSGMPIGEDKSLLADWADSSPSAMSTTAWNAMRTSSTIINGGTAGRLSRRRGIMASFGEDTGTGGFFKGGFKQTFNPTHFRRFTRPANIDPSAYGESSKIYSPFGTLAKEGNRAFNYAMKKSPNAAASISTRFGGEAHNPFAAGTLGRLSTIDKINKMSGAKFSNKSLNIASAIKDLNPEYYGDVFSKGIGLSGLSLGDDAMKFAYSAGVGSTMKSGFLSSQIGGYLQGTQAAYAESRLGVTGAKAAARSVIETGSHFETGFNKGASALAEGSKFAEFAGSGKLGMVMKGANVAGTILLVHDLAEMAGKTIGHGINALSDAGKSVIGSINKPVMGMGYKDNSVAATSRQRGVMAIQSSKLNMRSTLGSEAAGMAAHFG